jgi:hypothetical protein
MYEALGQALPGKVFNSAFCKKAIMWWLCTTRILIRWVAFAKA